MPTKTSFCVGSAGTELHLAVLVPTAQSWPEGRASIGAIALAVDAVNTHGALLSGRRILYRSREVTCDRLQAGAELNEMLMEAPVDAVIGPDCSLACESTAHITALRGIPHVSYSCSSSKLSDKTEFPTVRLLFAPRVSGQICYQYCLLRSLCARPRATRVGCPQSSALRRGQSGRSWPPSLLLRVFSRQS